MKIPKRVLFFAIIIAAAAFGGWWFGHRGAGGGMAGGGSAGGESNVVAQVQLAPVLQSNISRIITAYGSVVARPGKAISVSVLFECVVRHILVAPGESVTNGQALAEIQPSSTVQLQLAQAKAAVDRAERELKQRKTGSISSSPRSRT
jgi:multidrug efflux pump subunit AcrA (membrane-fusion protein)